MPLGRSSPRLEVSIPCAAYPTSLLAFPTSPIFELKLYGNDDCQKFRRSHCQSTGQKMMANTTATETLMGRVEFLANYLETFRSEQFEV
jgi:hypothetical protein